MLRQVRNPSARLHRKRASLTPEEKLKWLGSWDTTRARGKTWFILEKITLVSFVSLSAQWLLKILNLDAYVHFLNFDLMQSIYMGLFGGLIAFQESEYKYERYLSELQQPSSHFPLT